MATGKKYFWIKLKTDFMTSDKVDYLMSQPNGAEYVVLYQMLCMKCINTDGLLARKIGEVIIPFDAEKIQRDCKYFKIDTVKQAFQLFINLGMIYKEQNGYLRIAEFENMVGSETDYAKQKRVQRQPKEESKALEYGQEVDNSVDNVHIDTDIRDRDRYIYNVCVNGQDFGKLQHKLFEIINRHNESSEKRLRIPISKDVFSFAQKECRELLESIGPSENINDIIIALNNYLSTTKIDSWKNSFSWNDFKKNYRSYTSEYFDLQRFRKKEQQKNKSGSFQKYDGSEVPDFIGGITNGN